MTVRTLILALALVLGHCSCVLAQQFRVLLVTETAGWHHPSIAAAVPAVQKLAQRHVFRLDWHQQFKQLDDEQLKNYDVLLFINTTGDILNDEEQAAVERFVQSGKGFVGVHAASDTEYDWPWYTKMIGHMFKIHPKEQTAMLNVLDTDFPGLTRWAKRTMWTDEWYEYHDGTRQPGFNYLLTVDESTYDVATKWGTNVALGHGDFHPIAWYREYDGGRMFYTGLGHIPAIYEDPAFLDHLLGGLYYAAKGHTR